ncbi:hypothetical protein [Bradyrhizobium liaoningense]|uniref:hypothetical protein n=1 Tax=Bradyrhizobium liaoningense TaxID=43992 RepID=UPI001BA6E9A4|nr:hypothetical protein [Bradyrhizobium liaoningense]MBR0906143.1 hypothetical protein [Bradyrhizobium liaoningense]
MIQKTDRDLRCPGTDFARQARQSSRFGRSAAIPASHSALKRSIVFPSAVNAALCRHSVEPGFA